jgi:hypothetical protein
MSLPPNPTYFPDQRPAVLVVTHERSGTHFLMNSLAGCYGYVSQPWIDLDAATDNLLHTHGRPGIRDALLGLAARPLANVVKSHHAAEFFEGELARLTERYVVFVVCRDPVPTLLSFWRFMFRLPGDGGPKTADPLTFAAARPSGRVLRYQVQEHPDMMRRWAGHVESWLAAARQNPRIVVLRYEDLDQHFEDTVHSFAGPLGQAPAAIQRPARDFNVIPGGPDDPLSTGRTPDVAALRQLCRQTVGATMARLGY